ncbi:MAG: GAF domain-containing protein [Rubrobacter sp.]|nr:GAF domain-containing protein [Rubrobacter sp.]
MQRIGGGVGAEEGAGGLSFFDGCLWGVLAVGPDGSILRANPAARGLLGYSGEELEERSWAGLLDEEGRTLRSLEDGFEGEIELSGKDEVSFRAEVSVFEAADGGGFGVLFREAAGEDAEKEGLLESLRALMGLHEAGRVLGSTLDDAEIGQRLLEILERTSSLTAGEISLYDESGRLYTLSAAGKDGTQSPASGPEVESLREAALESGERQALCLDGHAVLFVPLLARGRTTGVLEARGPRSLLEERSVDLLSSLGGQAATALENARLYGTLARHEQRLQELVERLVGVQEEERRRVAREVHDGLTQVMVAVHQHLQAFSRDCPPESVEGRERLGRIAELVQKTTEDSRRITAGMRPTVLEDFGLAAAVRLEIETLREEGWRVAYTEDLGEERLPETVEITLYRVAQEALTNVRKHALADSVTVLLGRSEQGLRLEVRDRGRGFEPGAAPEGGSMGLPGMQDRVELLGGEFLVESRRGSGTRVSAEVSLPAPETGGGRG